METIYRENRGYTLSICSRTESKVFFASDKSDMLSKMFVRTFSYGIVFSTGDTWKEQRRFSLHVLRNFGVGRDVMGDRILAEVKKMSSYLLDECKGSGQAVLDLSMLLKLCVSNIIALIVFGHSFERGDPKFALVQRTVQDNFLLLNTPAIALLNSYPWIRHIPLFGHFGVDDLTKQEEILNGFLNDEVEAHKEKLKNRLEDDDEPSDFVDAYLKGKQP